MKQYNFIYLFASLLFLLVAIPLSEEFVGRVDALVVQVALNGALIVGIWTLVSARKWFIVGAGLAAAGFVLTATHLAKDAPFLEYASMSAVLLFWILTTVIALHEVLLGGPVDGNKLVGSVCIYLMLGLIWSVVYVFVHVASEGSFTGVKSTALEDQFLEFVYYSFVTLTTLGYGDLTPVNPLARALSYLEAVSGQLYLTILVAALVGIRISTWQGERVTESDT